MVEFNLLQKIIIWGIPIIFAITVHEVAHGWLANKLGDPTARMLGRLTLNPIKHIDLVGTIIIPGILLMLGGFIFGWAKPVPITTQNLHHPKRDMAFVAAMGPFANLIMALLWGGVAKLGSLVFTAGLSAGLVLVSMASAGIVINLVLMVLNLIPIPPLDGGRIVSGFLNQKGYLLMAKIEPYGFLILLAMLFTGVLGRMLSPAVFALQSLIVAMFSL